MLFFLLIDKIGKMRTVKRIQSHLQLKSLCDYISLLQSDVDGRQTACSQDK